MIWNRIEWNGTLRVGTFRLSNIIIIISIKKEKLINQLLTVNINNNNNNNNTVNSQAN